MERNNLGIRDPAPWRKGTKSRESLNDTLGQLVPCDFLDTVTNENSRPRFPSRKGTNQDNSLELIRTDKAILIGVKILEGLSKSLPLEALHHLCELVVYIPTLSTDEYSHYPIRNTHIPAHELHSFSRGIA